MFRGRKVWVPARSSGTMIRTIVSLLLLGCMPVGIWAQAGEEPQSHADQPAITIYNANFAVVRQAVPLDLKSGVNHVTFADATAHIEPDSVVLRDPQGKRTLQILEQNYRNDPITQELLLSLNEGKTIEFVASQWTDNDGKEHKKVVQGKLIRSGYRTQSQPIVEVNGELQFSLPGHPVFSSLGDGTILKPTLDWVLQTDHAGASSAELSYVTGGMNWHADYNVVAASKGDTVDIVGWITIKNETGKLFENARIKLIAGDVNKIAPQERAIYGQNSGDRVMVTSAAQVVGEKAFDEYHLYTLERSTTLRDRETKQVEFVVASGIKSQRIYVYNGAIFNGYYYEQSRNNYGTESNTKVMVMQEFKNSKANHLGIALPKGRVRFYRRDDDGQVEFTGENTIDHTAADETVRIYTGNAFDIVGERRRTDFNVDSSNRIQNESFEIKLRNHKKEAVEVRVVEKLYWGANWEIVQKTEDYIKQDAQTIEYRVVVPPDGEKVLTYKVHYSW
jgi:hypothetical protein